MFSLCTVYPHVRDHFMTQFNVYNLLRIYIIYSAYSMCQKYTKPGPSLNQQPPLSPLIIRRGPCHLSSMTITTRKTTITTSYLLIIYSATSFTCSVVEGFHFSDTSRFSRALSENTINYFSKNSSQSQVLGTKYSMLENRYIIRSKKRT